MFICVKNNKYIFFNYTIRCLVFGENEDLERSLRGQESFVLMKYDRQNVIPSCSEKLLDVLKHCVAIVHSNLKVILSDKKGLEKAGSLKGTDVPTVMSEEQIKLVEQSFVVVN